MLRKLIQALGLNIAKQIIDAHQGYISANNIEDNNGIIGARFIINLPIAK
jgi:signal transduction histidine kinase